MKLTEDQIKELYSFTRRRLVVHYDLQTELVDHLANGIEQQWLLDPTVSFKEALQIEFKKFGHFGFRNVLKRRKKAINGRYNKLLLTFYLEYFKFPKIILLLIGVSICFLVLKSFSYEYKYAVFGSILFVIGLYFTIVSHKTGRLFHQKIGMEKRWMLEERILTIGTNGAGILNLPIMFISLDIWRINNVWIDFGISLFSILCLALYYVMIFVLPNKVDELMAKNNPEYKFISKQWV